MGVMGSHLTELNLVFNSLVSKTMYKVQPLRPHGSVSASWNMFWAIARVNPLGKSTSPTDRWVLLAVLNSASSLLERASIKAASSVSGYSVGSHSASETIEKKN